MELRFTLFDYAFLVIMLGLSACVGVYYGFLAKKKQDTTEEYLMGSKELKVFPVAMSLTAGHVSAVTVLAVPVEMYLHGTQYWSTAISGFLVTLSMAYIFLPVFHSLQLPTIYTYLERRFDHRQRMLASGLYCLSNILYMPILIYAPSLAFNQVTGVNIHITTTIISIICIFYTTIGGVRAVVWTDMIQFVAMIFSICAVMILGTIAVGGLGNLYEINAEGGRIIWFNMEVDPTARSTFWSHTIGLTALWITGVGISPESVTRFLSVPTYKDAQKTLWIFGFGHIAVKMFAVYCGVIIYARYYTCDPYTIGVISKADQLFPYYVMDMARSIPGLSGLFISGVFSAALSSMSSCLNVLSGTIYGDFIKPKFPNTTEKTASTILKAIVLSVGCFAIGMVFVVAQLGNMFSLAISILGVTSGVLLGMFTMGMLLPNANRHGAFWGSIISLMIVITLSFGAQLAIANKELKYEMLPLRTDGCADKGYPDYMNSTSFIGTPNSTVHIYNQNADNSNVPWIFRLGFMYYSLVGTLLVFIIGYPISLYTGGYEVTDERLFAPCIKTLLRYNNRKRKGKEAKASSLRTLNDIVSTEMKNVEYSIVDTKDESECDGECKEGCGDKIDIKK